MSDKGWNDIMKLITEEEIGRINELWKKSKEGELTAEEKEEQQKLRRLYIDSVKHNLRGHLNNISIKHEDGSVTKLADKR